MRRPTSVELMLLTTVLLWALNLSVTRYILTHGLAPLSYATVRYALAGIVFVALTLGTERSIRIEPRHARVLLVAAVLLWLNQLSFVLALDVTTASTVGLLLGVMPIFAALFGVVLGRERLTRRFWVAAAISALGVAFVAIGSEGQVSPGAGGIVLGLGIGATWAAYSVAVTPLMASYSPIRVSAVVVPLSWLLIALSGIPQTSSQDWAVGWEVWVLLLFATFGPLVLTNVLWFRSLGRIGPARATLAVNLQPFVAAVLAVILLSEPLGLVQVLGGVLIGLSILIARRRRPRSDEPRIGLMSEHDFMPIDGWDHIEIWVGNAKQSAYFYEHAYGFTRTAYAGPETGVRDRASYVLEQGEIRLVLTSGLRADSDICKWAATKGDSARDVALAVPDATNAYRQAVQRGARGVVEPHWVEDDSGRVELAAIATYGDNIHSFVNRSEYSGAYLPGYRSTLENGGGPARGAGLVAIDHVVGNVELGRMDEWVDFYARVLGFTQLTHFSDEDISTEYSALMSKVMTDGQGKIKFPINEPAEGKRKSQIEEYLEFHGGPGVQHIALQTDEIVRTVAWLREHGVLFIATPDSYYDIVQERVGDIDEDWADLRSMGILVDRDEEGYLLQLFTKIVQDRPTLFFEVIERHGSRGFGLGNFKSLFEAIEREQALRGNL